MSWDQWERRMRLMSVSAMRLLGLVLIALTSGKAAAQAHNASRVEIAWNRYYTYEQIEGQLRSLADAYPELVELRSIGKSLQGRDMWLAIVTSPDVEKGTDAHAAKPAMWIDGNIHANEIQAAEVVTYSIWYLTKEYGKTPAITDLLDRTTFYMLPVVNPDSRAAWFRDPSTPHSPRGNQRPIDDDGDGRVDEDGFEDLDGDGSITWMWKRDPNGDWIRNRFDDRVFERAPRGQRGEWSRLGWEGVDSDGDGRLNEDGAGGDDMNRNWPSDWKPPYVQRGAGPYPLSHPETRAIATWIYEQPNIAAFQSYHNTGGMVLRGPGTSYREGDYPSADRRVYDELASEGVKLLPFYRDLVIYRDLYDVHGGEATWASEGLGIVSFTNELFTAGKYFMRDGLENPNAEQMMMFRDRLDFGSTFKDYEPFDHPQLGEVLIGGANKWSSRSTPTFMLEDECHRNFAFTMYHASEMPELSFERVDVERLAPGADVWRVSVEVRNESLIPTRTERARIRKIGTNDRLECEVGGGTVVASGSIENWWDERLSEETRFEPGRVQLAGGVPSRGVVAHRFIVEAPEGARVTLRYVAEKASDLERVITLGEGSDDLDR
ncbi:MAG: peptidase M14 [Phycisphaerae bacterium]|nr:peptidase M14 [Phycisphaerae bacterium]